MPASSNISSHPARLAPESIPLADAMRELRRRPRNTWLELVRSDLGDRWRQPPAAPVEEYFALLPELRRDLEETLILICSEREIRRQRGEMGAGAADEEYLARFPELQEQLTLQFRLNDLLSEADAETGPPERGDLHALLRSAGYELLGELGRGASGRVYQARQLSLNRLVAIKCLDNPGGDPKRAARLRQEAELLARVRHPNIVQVYEVAPLEGQLYLMMELVEGPTLAEVWAGQPAPSEEAARLVSTLAQAVAAMHDAHILHRDLKPSNVLMTSVGQPKISDFGLAKLTGDSNFLTTHDSILGTPCYMSPEQALSDADQIGSATDIYSLGAILYELLVGRPPFVGVTVFDTLAMIRDREPVAPHLLQPKTPRDLETICLKCLEKNPAQRYASALDLSHDLARFLAGDAIVARQPTWWEQTRRSYRKNRATYWAIASVLSALVLGVSVAVWGLFREQAARQRAELARDAADQAAQHSQQVATFLKEILQGVDPAIARGRDTTLLQQILSTAAERCGRELANQPEIEAELKSTIGATYFRLGELQSAEQMYRDALQLRQSVFGANHPLVAESWNNIARVLINLGDPVRFSEAEAAVAEALRIERSQHGEKHAETALSLYLQASLWYRRGKLPEAEALYRQVLEIRREVLGPQHQDVAATLNNLSLTLNDQRQYPEAEETLRSAIAIQQRVLPTDHPDFADTRLALAGVLSKQGQLPEAETAAREALRIRRKVLGENHASVVAALSRLAGILAKGEQRGQVDSVYGEAIAMQQRLTGAEHPAVATVRENYAELLLSLGRVEDAEAQLRQALAVRRAASGNQHPDTHVSMLKLAMLLRKEQEYPEAQALLEERLAYLRAQTPRNNFRVGNTLAELTLTLLPQAEFSEAEQKCRELIKITQQPNLYESPWFGFYARSLLGASLLGQQKYVEAEPLLLAGYNGMVATAHANLSEPELRARETAEWLVALYRATNRPDEQAKWEAQLKTHVQP